MEAYFRIIFMVVVFFGLGIGIGISYANMRNTDKNKFQMKLGASQELAEPPVEIEISAEEELNVAEENDPTVADDVQSIDGSGEDQGDEILDDPSPPPPQPIAPPLAPAPVVHETVALEPGAIRIWHQQKTGKMIVEMDGRVFELNEEPNAEEREKLEKFSSDMEKFLGGAFQPEPEEEEDESQVLGALSLFTPSSIAKGIASKEVEIPEDESNTLASQVNRILREKLKNSPLDKRGIQINEGVDGNIVFQVGLDRYQSMHEIPDADIRNVIRESVEEWQEGQ